MRNTLKNKARKILATIRANINIDIPVKGSMLLSDKVSDTPYNSKFFAVPFLKNELSVEGGGTSVEIRKYKISDDIRSNTKVAVIDCELTLNTSKPGQNVIDYFKTLPSIKSGDNFSISIVKKETSNGKITKCRFRVYYKSKFSTTVLKPDTCVIDYGLSDYTVTRTKIHGVRVGGKTINPSGENRVIKIDGTPGAKYGLTINERILDKDGVYTGRHNDVSIISKMQLKNSVGTIIDNYNNKINYIHGTIGGNGNTSFIQRFPSNIILKTKISSGASSATQTFKSVNGVKVGDKVYSSAIPKTSTVRVNSINTVAKTCVLSESVNLATGANIEFKRNRSFSGGLVQSACSELDENFTGVNWESFQQSWPDSLFTFYQSLETDVTIINSMTGGGSAFGTITGLSRGDSLITKVSNKSGRHYKEVKVVMSFTLASGTISKVKSPRVISSPGSRINHVANKSFWTNSNHNQNGGTKFSIKDFSRVIDGANVKIKYTVCISNFGTKPVTFDLALEDIIIPT